MQVGVIGGAPAELLRGLVASGVSPCVLEDDGQADASIEGVTIVEGSRGFFDAMEPPRLHVLAVRPGPEVDRVLDHRYLSMEPGDLVVDATGSWWCDTLRRFRRMRHRSIFHVDVAKLSRRGRTVLCASGDREGIDLALPLLRRWAAPGTALPLGSSGLAHFALQVEEALALAARQAQGEAAQMLQAWPGEAHHEVVDELWPLPGPLPDLGRAGWLPEDALRLEAPVPQLSQAVMLTLAEALDEHVAASLLPKIGPFGLSEEILG